MENICSLCHRESLGGFFEAYRKNYQLCSNCGVVLLEKSFHLATSDEAKHYLTHNNTRENQGYVDFLNQLITPLSSFLMSAGSGLDYGSGPGPVASELLADMGFSVSCYDPYFAPEEEVFDKQYDFVLCTEVAEHFREPLLEFKRIDSLIKPGGYFGLMTLLYSEEIDFSSWWYPRDATHCTFYQLASLEFLQELFSWELIYSDAKRVFVFKKAL